MKRFVSLAIVSLLGLAVLPHAATAQPVEHISVSVPFMNIPMDFIGEGDLPIKMRLRHRPVTADVSAVQWISSDPAVATVDNEGIVKLVKPGKTAISAKLGDLATADDPNGVGKAQCVLTVLPAENRSAANRNLLNLPPIEKDQRRNDAADFLKWPEKYGDTVVALWPHNATAAYMITSDDLSANRGSLGVFIRQQEQYGTPVTLMFDYADHPSFADIPDDALVKFINGGGSLASHSLRHNVVEIDKYLTSDCIWDFGGSRDLINARLDTLADRLDRRVRCRAWALPGGNAASETWRAIRFPYLRKFYITSRGGAYAGHSPQDYLKVGFLVRPWTILADKPGVGNLEGNFRAVIEPDYTTESGNNYGGTVFTILHGFQGGQNDFIAENFYVPNKHAIHAGTFDDVLAYAQQRDTAEIKDKTATPDRIEFSVADILCDEAFFNPLTIKVRLDESWNKLAATQDGKPTPSRLVKNGGHVYALVQAVPDRGRVALKKEGEVKKYSSNATLAALEYRTDKELILNDEPLPPRHPVPGFTPDKTDYTVTLPPGTPMAAFYATPADPAAAAQRHPTMGIVRFTTAPNGANVSSESRNSRDSRDSKLINSNPSNSSNPSDSSDSSTTTITVTAEDETVKTYTLTFKVAPFDPITALAIDTPANLQQEGDAQPVDFTATAQPAGRVDLDAIEWYVNGEKQTPPPPPDTQTPVYANGPKPRQATFRYTPLKNGTYTVQARAGSVASEKRDIVFAKGAFKPITVILDENFSRHAAGKPVPLSDNPADNKLSATTPNIPPKWKTGEEGLKIAEVEGIPSTTPTSGKAASWTTLDNTTIAGLSKTFPNSATEPLAVAFKVRADNPEGGNLFKMHLLPAAPSPQLPQHAVFQMAKGNQLTNFLNGWHAGWDPKSQKWLSVVYTFDPSHKKADNPRVNYEGYYIGNQNYDGKTEGREPHQYMAFTGFGGRNTAKFTDKGDIAVVFDFAEGPKDTANLGKFSTYLTDVKIYRPGSFVMTPAKPAFTAGEPVRMNFSHHANLTTLKPAHVTVTDSKGAPVPVETLATDYMNSDHVLVNFPSGALKRGETYTMDFDENVRDVMDKTLYEPATFKVQ